MQALPRNLRQPGDQVPARPELDRRALEVVAHRLRASAEMPREEELGDRGERPAILHATKAVAVVGVPDVRHRYRALPHRLDDLIRFRRLHPDVVGALTDDDHKEIYQNVWNDFGRRLLDQFV